MKDFGFSTWPFSVVPDQERGVTLWADRARTKSQLTSIVEEWTHARQSTITLMWADLGSGKTHTLYYLRALCQQQAGWSCSYVLLPQAITKFLDLYRAIAREFNWSAVSSQTLTSKSWTVESLKKALLWLKSDSDVTRQNLARQWLAAEKLNGRQCQMLGIAQPISSPEDAVDVLAAAINSVVAETPRLILMVDEYQRVAEGKRKQLQEIGHGIHTLFNACPRQFSLVLSCATGANDDVTTVLTPEIVSRLSPKRIELPYLTEEDILNYVSDLFAHYRVQPVDTTATFFPLTEQVARQFAEFLVNGLNGEATPRRLNQAFGELLGSIRHSPLEIYSVEEYMNWIASNGAALLRTIIG